MTNPSYDKETVERIRQWTSDCETWLEARSIIATRLSIHPDNVTKMHKKHGLWEQPIDLKNSTERVAAFGKSFEALRKTTMPVTGRPLRRLFMDIETSPNVVLSWRIGYKINLDHSNILKERAIICIGWKWEHESAVHELHWDENQCDKKMLEEFMEVAAEADEIVMHNGDKFDLPWFKTRCLFHGLPPLPEYKTVDTLQWARRKFYFNSNRLDYIAKFLGLGGKIKTEFGLWKAIVLDKCPESMTRMLTYCKKDVALLEQVWKRLSEMMPVKTHGGVLAGGDKWTCPRDGSTNVSVSKVRVTANGTKQYQMKCGTCGGYFTINAAAYATYLEAKK